MSMISEQVKELRIVAETYRQIGKELSAEYLSKAADTIEALSAKLQAANVENGGGWILCEDRLPDNFEVVLVFTEEKQIVTVARDGEDWVLYNQGIIKERVLAWQPLPEPYRP